MPPPSNVLPAFPRCLEVITCADSPAMVLGADGEQGGDGDLGQAEPVVQDGGEEPVGEGEYESAAGAGGGQAGAMASASVQA